VLKYLDKTSEIIDMRKDIARSIWLIALLGIALSIVTPAIASPKSDTDARVMAIGEKVGRAANMDVRIILIQDSPPEAYVYPDGVIALTTGLINLAKEDDEIAFVIGHEIAHIVRGHLKQESVLRVLSNIYLPRDARYELEADIGGILYAKAAGYNPTSAIRLLGRMLLADSAPNAYFEKRLDIITGLLVGLLNADEEDTPSVLSSFLSE